MLKQYYKCLLYCILSIALLGCSTNQFPLFISDSSNKKELEPTSFLKSGTLLLSHRVPTKSSIIGMDNNHPTVAPLIGYFPPAIGYVPTKDELWIKISSKEKKLFLMKGKENSLEIQAEGKISVSKGKYLLQQKQKNPLWYAPDSYFSKRLLNIPEQTDRTRYRRGAYGEFALYATDSFVIHSAPIWTEEVGGLKIKASDISLLYSQIQIGTPVVVN
jgi:lipoprotein-anchoring transpeptidase ErfK/SrfK